MKTLAAWTTTATLAVAMAAGAALAEDRGVPIGMVPEPPNLDPAAGPAAAIDEVVHANIFGGPTRLAADTPCPAGSF